VSKGEYPYHVIATELDDSIREFDYIYESEKPLTVDATFRDERDDELLTVYRVVGVIFDRWIEAKAIIGSGPLVGGFGPRFTRVN
jgi:hypothetical protein